MAWPTKQETMSTEKHYCTCCEKPLKEDKIVWLELSQTDDNYYTDVPNGHESQGAFPFGAACAKKQLKQTKSQQEMV